MRAFIAIELPLTVKNSLVEIQDKLKLTLPKVNWVAPANLHLSLKFLGEVSIEQIQIIHQIIAEINKTITPFKVKIKTLDVFPDYRQARIIWAGTNQAPGRLQQLVDQLQVKLPKIGLPQEERLFRAHITLGRIKNPLIPGELESTLEKVKNDLSDMGLEFNTERITLFESALGEDGPTYTILKS